MSGRHERRSRQGERGRQEERDKTRVIGDYEVGKTLGSGSFGKVKLGKQILTGLPVAMKFFQISKVVTSEQWSRVHREILLLKQVDHPNITKFFDVIQTENHIILITELLDNGELFDYIVKKKCLVPEDEARKFFQQLISAVDYCHKRGIVHRDLKPENLLLDRQNNLKIADFGLSNIMRDGDFLQTSCGSPNYAAPEVIDGVMYNGPEVDVWSCGVILYILLVGHLPFDNQHIPSLFRQIKTARFTLPALMRRDAKELISGILVVNIHNRMTIEQIRQSSWFLRDLPENLRTAPTTPVIQRTMRQLTEKQWLGNENGNDFKPFINITNGDHIDRILEDEDDQPDIFEQEETDLGEINMRAVEELVSRAKTEGGEVWDTELVVQILKDGAKVKKLRIGYQLCKEYLKYQEMHLRRQFAEGLDELERNKPLQPNDFVLPTPMTKTKPQASDSPAGPKQRWINSSIGTLESSLRHKIGDHISVSSKSTSWTFGIRSTGPSCFVIMRCIYEALRTLNIEWMKPNEAFTEEEMHERQQLDDLIIMAHTGQKMTDKQRQDLDNLIKKISPKLFAVKARFKAGEIILRFDIVVYQQPSKGETKYTVDFRNQGYYNAVVPPLEPTQIGEDGEPLVTEDENWDFSGQIPHLPLVFLDLMSKIIQELTG